MRIVVTGTDCPRIPGVRVGVQRGKDEVVQEQPADGADLTWELDARLVGADLRGPFVHGRPGDRFLYLCWASAQDGRIGRTKLMLDAVPPDDLERAERGHLAARLPLARPDGRPVLAAVRPPRIEWTAVDG